MCGDNAVLRQITWTTCVCCWPCAGHFLLTNLLLDDLKQTAADGGDARIVVVTSSFHDPDTGPKKKNGTTATTSTNY